MQVGTEFIISADIGLNDRSKLIERVFFGLTHQGLGDGRDTCLTFYRSVRIDIGYLGVPQAEDIYCTVILIDITGDDSPDDLITLFIFLQGKITKTGKIRNQVAGMMIRSL